MRRWASMVAIVAAALATGCTSEELGEEDQASHAWGGYHWARTSNPFTLQVGDNVSSAWDGYLVTTVSDWSRSQVLDLTRVAGGASGRRCKGTTGRAEVCNARYGNNGWLGVASISVTGGTHITQGTVKLNDTYFDTARYDTPAWRNLVMCQEVGHVLGLDHQDEDFGNPPLGTCMDYSNDPEPNQHPDAHDYAQLEDIYRHLDSTTTVGAGAGQSAGAGDSPREWGERIGQSRGGRQETYARRDGRDLVITFVTWAEE